ncbi:von Willebrand factor type A domain-containing protein [Simiduia sp. 21SJ11W-1]|uniref:vWA domain-containing protein n=1 Tax=Simiduia sp. 21SJ11W-1 TaxID=2909669 RepID=UPI0020A1E92D|nr:VWA domain-containing protein [Simiduia sp. 21SJ11W-1]UTA47674.1 von Willebrand factor type A domain-containing protein [Simiduia sp. 21SJ11W-1]
MTDQHNRPNDDLERALNEAQQAPVNESAKARAINAALAEFDLAQKKSNQRQGFWQGLRPMGTLTTLGQSIMELFQRKWLYSGIAAASVAVLTVMVTQQMQQELVTPALPEASNVQAPSAELYRADQTTGPRAPAERLAGAKPESPAPAALEEVVVERAASPANLLAIAPPKRQQKAVMAEYQAAMPAPKVSESIVSEPSSPQAFSDQGRDSFETVDENPVQRVVDAPVSTFSIDVDTSAYSFVRRQLNQGVLPQKAAVRVEEMVNYFDYQYPAPEGKSTPFNTHVVVSDSPWAEGRKLMHIGIKGYEMAAAAKPKTNLVFLLDVSGSMNAADKLPLVKQSMELLLSQLAPDDTVAIAVYAGAAGTVLAPTLVQDKQKILHALQQLSAGGTTAGAQGIKLAYQLAAQNFDKQAVNRVILATDGDFNVGITDREELKGFVEREREKGIYLSVLGFGQGNYHDNLMQTLAQNGNGVAAYIDTLSEAQKVLVTEATRNLFPIAQDVKIQVEFNPATVQEYRLIGYETRALAREDFNNDKVDAGDIGAGHTVTAIYEFTPTGAKPLIESSRYSQAQNATALEATPNTNEYAFVKLRYKLPGGRDSKLIEQPVAAQNTVNPNTRVAAWVMRETQFATAVAGFAQLLKGGKYTGSWSYDDALALAQANKGEDLYGYRTEFVQLVRKAKMAQGI